MAKKRKGKSIAKPFIQESYYLKILGRKVPVFNMEDASRKWIAIINALGIGASGLSGDDGAVIDESGRVIAQVSYNGRVWGPEDYPHSALMYDPRDIDV